MTWNGTTNRLELFVDHVSIGSATNGAAFAAFQPDIGFGFNPRTDNRSVDGIYSAVAFSTFDGTFNPATDFQLSIPIPEPSSVALLGMAASSCIAFGRRGRR
jgi:hypothetical protein